MKIDNFFAELKRRDHVRALDYLERAQAAFPMDDVSEGGPHLRPAPC